VVLTAPSEFAELITGCGLRCIPHDIDLGIAVDMSDVNPRKAAMKFLSPSGMRETGRTLLAALRDEPADVLLLSPFAEFAGHPLAEKRGIPAWVCACSRCRQRRRTRRRSSVRGRRGRC
jgi:sterol 3beta-glucosyltransferase